MADISDHLKELLDKITQKEHIENARYEVNKGSEKGDNYIGEMIAVDVLGTSKNESNKTLLHLMVKQAPKNDALRTQMPVRKVYEEEIFVYTYLIPTFKAFEAEALTENCSGFDGLTKCYETSMVDKNETLVLENLNFLKYRMWNRKIPMDETHVKMVLDQYAHFHSFSFCIKDQKPELFKEITSKVVPVMDIGDMDKWMNGYNMTFQYLIDTFNNDSKAVKFLEHVKATFRERCMGFMQQGDLDVIVHGDCWCNNMMFQYDDDTSSDRPKHVILLDWQMSRLGSLLSDLSYFFYCSASQDIINNYKEYQKHYYERLKTYCSNMNTNIEEIFPFDRFCKDWDSHRMLGLAIACMMMRILVTEKTEAIDMEKIAAEGKNIMESFNYKSVNEDVFLKRIKDLIDHFVETYKFEDGFSC